VRKRGKVVQISGKARNLNDLSPFFCERSEQKHDNTFFVMY
jgi:hypothetical protein